MTALAAFRKAHKTALFQRTWIEGFVLAYLAVFLTCEQFGVFFFLLMYFLSL